MNKSTRTFSFPNQGHSVRKLIASLQEMDPSIGISLCYEWEDNGSCDISFIERNSAEITVQQLINVLPRLGTRFTLVNRELKFYFDFDDILYYPEIYCN